MEINIFEDLFACWYNRILRNQRLVKRKRFEIAIHRVVHSWLRDEHKYIKHPIILRFLVKIRSFYSRSVTFHFQAGSSLPPNNKKQQQQHFENASRLDRMNLFRDKSQFEYSYIQKPDLDWIWFGKNHSYMSKRLAKGRVTNGDRTSISIKQVISSRSYFLPIYFVWLIYHTIW